MNRFIRTFVLCLVFLCASVKFIAHGHSIHMDGHGELRRESQEPIRNPHLQQPQEEEEEDIVNPEANNLQSREQAGVRDEGATSQDLDPTAATPNMHSVDRSNETECPACFHRKEEAKRYRIEYIKRTILEKLNMKSPPNTSHFALPRNAEFTRILNEHFSGPKHTLNPMPNDDPQSSRESSTRTENMFLFPKKPPSEWNINENTSYAFTFSEKLFNYDVRSASLHVHVRSRRGNDADSIYYLILRSVHDPPDGSNNPKVKAISKKKIHLHVTKGHWVVLNLTRVAQDWLDNPEEHNVIQMTLTDVDGNNYDQFLDTNIDKEYRKRSFLMMKIKEKRNYRFKRDIDEGMICPANSQVTSCCRYAMVIDFEEIGWDWIIAPRSYAANYCQGECPRMYLLEYAHTHILESVGTHPFGGTGPCCAPRQMSDLPMLHTDTNENIQFTTIAAMKVDSCHCA